MSHFHLRYSLSYFVEDKGSSKGGANTFFGIITYMILLIINFKSVEDKLNTNRPTRLAMFFRDVRPSFQRSNGLEFYLWKERFPSFF